MQKVIPQLELALQILLLGLMVAIVLAQANPLFQSPNRDSGLFMYMGSQLLEGKLLYVDIWDNKGPLIFYINAIGLFLGRGYRWGVWGMEFIFLFFATLLGFNLMKRMWGIMPAIFGTSLWLLGLNNVMRGGNFTEDYSLLFNFAALYLFSLELQRGPNWSRQFLIGGMLALNFLLRANNIGVQLSIGLVIVVTALIEKEYSQALKKLMWIAVGSLSVFLLVSAYFLYFGTFEEMVIAGYTYNLFYSEEKVALDGLWISLSRGLRLIGYISIVPALLGFLLLFEKLPDTIRSGRKDIRDFYLLALIGWPLEVILSGLSGRNYPHYYVCWLPYIAILSGLLLYFLIPVLNEYLKKYSVVVVLTATLLVSLIQTTALDQYRAAFGKMLFDRSTGIEYIDPIAKYVRDNTNVTDTVLVWGFQPYINLMAKRDSSTGILSYPVLVESPFSDELNDRFLQDLIQNKPALIVDMVNPDNDTIPFIDPALRETQKQRLKNFNAPSNLDRVFEYIFENYHVETKIGRVLIYRLNDATP